MTDAVPVYYSNTFAPDGYRFFILPDDFFSYDRVYVLRARPRYADGSMLFGGESLCFNRHFIIFNSFIDFDGTTKRNDELDELLARYHESVICTKGLFARCKIPFLLAFDSTLSGFDIRKTKKRAAGVIKHEIPVRKEARRRSS